MVLVHAVELALPAGFTPATSAFEARRAIDYATGATTVWFCVASRGHEAVTEQEFRESLLTSAAMNKIGVPCRSCTCAFCVIAWAHMASALRRLLTPEAIRHLAEAKSFDRGELYFLDGHVANVVEHAGKLSATVHGTDTYRVTLSVENDALNHDCTCPMGAEGAFCKHCVAVGLAWLAHSSHTFATAKANSGAGDVVTLNDVRLRLLKQEKGKLVDIILEQAARDERLRERLLLEAARSAGKEVNVAAIRKAVERATNTRGFVAYRAAHDFSCGVDQVVDSIAALLGEGHAAEVIDLAEYALGKVEQAILHMDDSDGHMASTLSRLQEIHLTACCEAKPDPEKLAKRLFDWEMRTSFDTFYGAVGTYASILGERGLAVYRRRAEAAWAKVPAVGPGEKDPEQYGLRFRIAHVMEALARQSADIESLVAVKSHTLSTAYAFLEIAEIYREAKQHDNALAWAERGVKAFPEHTDHRLREFLAHEYHRRKRHDEAMRLIWTGFIERIDLESYQKLKEHADGIGQWPAFRGKALAFLRAAVREKQQSAKNLKSSWARHDHSRLVEIFLWEGDTEAAWHEAQTGGCYDSLWLELAHKREIQFPAEVIPIYQKHVEALINQKHNASYAESVKVLRKIENLMTRAQQRDQFPGYLNSVRAAHKPKRNFIAMAARL
jgi:uncharacterized Zn finger protein